MIKTAREGQHIRRCARPIRHKSNSEKVVLCIHGYTGYPGELSYPAQHLIQFGWDVVIPRLSGHGTSGEDFRQSGGIALWRRQVADEYINLAAEYQHVCVLGHSMGGLLALDLALRYEIRSLSLLAPCIGFYPGGHFLLRLISLFFHRVPHKWEKDPDIIFYDERDDDDDDYLGGEYWRWRWPLILADLFQLEKNVEKSLAQVKAPVLGIFSRTDKTLGYKGLKILETGLKSKFSGILLESCGHNVPYDIHPGNKEKAMEATTRWFEDSLN